MLGILVFRSEPGRASTTSRSHFRMRTTLTAMLESRSVLLADGATGTNYMDRGLGAGEPPELWNVDSPERVRKLHQDFVDAGSDIILTNTFGCTANRLK